MSTAWQDCSFLTCSVLPVRLACQCACPFCFSRSSISALESEPVSWSDDALLAHYRWSASRGATRLVVTGGGEPLLRPEQCLRAIRVGASVFDEIALFTNGARLDGALATALRTAGLSYLCWSRHDITDHDNRALMGDAAPGADAVLTAAHQAGLAVRATCVMSSAGIHDTAGVWRYIEQFRSRGVLQFTFKHTYVARERSVFTSSPANAWSRDHQIEADPFGDDGEVIGTLPWGPTIRRFGEVQACHYYEPTPQWELQHRLARSSNLMSDGRVYASLEDQTSLVAQLASSMTPQPSPRSMASTSAG